MSQSGSTLAWASQRGFYVHQRVTYQVIGTNVPRAHNAILSHAHVYADAPQFQTGEYAFRHAMRHPGQTVWEASDQANQFVRMQFERAWAATTVDEALFQFGLALHTLQDSTSPSHVGFQVWSGSESSMQLLQHGRRELLTPGRDSALFHATESAWQWFQQGYLPQGNLFIFGTDDQGG